MTRNEIAQTLDVSSEALGQRLHGWYVPTYEKGQDVYYRMLEVLQLAPGRFCPVCMAPLPSERDYCCSKPCYRVAQRALSHHQADLSIGVPPIVIPLTGCQMRALRAMAKQLDLPLQVAIRLTLAKASEEAA